MRVSLPAQAIASDVWEAHLSPGEIRTLGGSPNHFGATTVVLLGNAPQFSNSQLSFNPVSANVVNIGSSPRTLFVGSPSQASASPTGRGAATGDADFLAQLPPSLKELGDVLLASIRRHWMGDLRASPSGRFVETPDNFWTVKIQPRDGSLRLTVRGEPERLAAAPQLGVQQDRRGYSTFKISRVDQIPLVVDVLGRARHR
jgi:hypothetical protein